jgi:hypothetical protein
MMCKKYPSTKKHLYTIFNEFFLKTGDSAYTNPNKLVTIMNILNYNCKGIKHFCSKRYPSYVLPEDIALLKEAENINIDSLIERWEFSKVLGKALKKYGEVADDDGQDLQKNKSKSDGDAEPADDSEDDDSGFDGDDSDDSDEDCEGAGGSGDEDEDSEKSNKKGKGKKPSNGDLEEDELDDLLDENAGDLNDHHEKLKHIMDKSTTYELPTGKELLEFTDVHDIYEKGCATERTLEEAGHFHQLASYKMCVREAKKVANKIFTQFNMRVQASNLANVQYKNSGMLDPERAALYQVYDDVFMKNAIDPQQQNHAYSIVLDWSGSMDNSIFALMLRIMELTYFAKSAGIEIEVWLYTTGIARLQTAGLTHNVATVGSKFIKVLNTKKHQSMELDQRIKAMWIVANQIQHQNRISGDGAVHIRHFGTGGTNVLEGLILGHYVLSQMDADKKTCFLLSDGDDNERFELLYNAKTKSSLFGHQRACKVYANGIDVEVMYPDARNLRAASSKAVADMYQSIGQRTTGIAWNCNGSSLGYFCEKVIVGQSRGVKALEYDHADNLFVNEIIKNLL